MSGTPASARRGRALWLLAIALGISASVGGSWLATRGRLLFWWDWPTFPAYVPLLSAPFALLALLGVRAWPAWAIAIGITIVFWGGFFSVGSGTRP